MYNRLETHFAEDHDGRAKEKMCIDRILRINGYPDRFINEVSRSMQHARDRRNNVGLEKDEHWAAMPYVNGMSEAIACVLKPLSIRIAHRADPWKWRLCNRIKDKIPSAQKTGIVYSIPCADC